MRLFIITGTSQGLGNSLARIALSWGDQVIGISRGSALKQENFYSIKHDLSSPVSALKKLDLVLKKLSSKKMKEIVLINNAAGIEPVGITGTLPVSGVVEQTLLNFTAPIILSNFVTERFGKKSFIVNIISGAAYRPVSGWSLYCSEKAGLKMYTECLVEEGVRSISFSPGIMDTGMQATIRKQKQKDFSRVKEFRSYKDQHQLLSSDKVANVLMDVVNTPDKIDRIHYSVDDFP